MTVKVNSNSMIYIYSCSIIDILINLYIVFAVFWSLAKAIAQWIKAGYLVAYSQRSNELMLTGFAYTCFAVNIRMTAPLTANRALARCAVVTVIFMWCYKNSCKTVFQQCFWAVYRLSIGILHKHTVLSQQSQYFCVCSVPAAVIAYCFESSVVKNYVTAFIVYIECCDEWIIAVKCTCTYRHSSHSAAFFVKCQLTAGRYIEIAIKTITFFRSRNGYISRNS